MPLRLPEVLHDAGEVRGSYDRAATAPSSQANPPEELSSFKYLGVSFTATGQAIGKIKARINVARAAFNRLQPPLWSGPEISRHQLHLCALPPKSSCNAGSNGSGMLLAVPRSKPSVTSSNQSRSRTRADSEVVS